MPSAGVRELWRDRAEVRRSLEECPELDMDAIAEVYGVTAEMVDELLSMD